MSNVATYKPNAKYDVVVASDIIEHMTFDEVAQCYKMVSDSLSEEGIFVVHTFPNSWHYDYHYNEAKVTSLWFFTFRPKNRFEKLMHINEQNPRVLLRQLKREFSAYFSLVQLSNDPTGSLNGKKGHHHLSEYRDLYAIASNEPIDFALVKESLSPHLWKRKDIMHISLKLLNVRRI